MEGGLGLRSLGVDMFSSGESRSDRGVRSDSILKRKYFHQKRECFRSI